VKILTYHCDVCDKDVSEERARKDSAIMRKWWEDRVYDKPPKMVAATYDICRDCYENKIMPVVARYIILRQTS
jgi:hypothetical protein